MTECNQSSFEFQAHFSRQVTARFDGGSMTSDAGAVLLRQTGRRLNLLPRFAACLARGPQRVRGPPTDPAGRRRASPRGASSQKVAQEITNCKENYRVRGGACRGVSPCVRGSKLTVDQEVGGSSPPSCTRQLSEIIV